MRAPIGDGGAAFGLAGVFTTAPPEKQEINGAYWGSTHIFDANMSVLAIYASGNFYTNASSTSCFGMSIRCIAK
jgi:hypothetical protein